jgi:hypothetical protein
MYRDACQRRTSRSPESEMRQRAAVDAIAKNGCGFYAGWLGGLAEACQAMQQGARPMQQRRGV